MKTAILAAVAAIAFAGPPALAGDPGAMSVEDYVLDQGSMDEGQPVAISGSAMCINGDFCVLTKGTNVMTQVMFKPSKLAREDRKHLLDCNAIVHPCQAVVTGTTTGDVFHSVAATGIKFIKN